MTTSTAPRIIRPPGKTITVDRDNLFRGTEPSFWRLYSDGVTSTFADLYINNDPQQVYWKYVRGYSGPDTSLPLEFGSCCHKIREWAYISPIFLKTCKAHGAKQVVGDLVQLYEQFWKKMYVKTPTRAQAERQEMVYGLAEVVMTNYFRRWDGDLTGKYTYGTKGTVSPRKWLAHEQTFDIPYTYPDGKVVRLRGRRDGVFTDDKGNTWILDTKCMGRPSNQDITDTLPTTFQPMLYCYALAVETGKYPKGVVWDVIKRPQERQGKASLPDFLGRVKKKWDDDKFYEENYARFRLSLSRKEIDHWKITRLDKFMTELRMWWEGTYDPCPRDGLAIGKYGRCEMFSAVTRGETIGYVKRNAVFPELED